MQLFCVHQQLGIDRSGRLTGNFYFLLIHGLVLLVPHIRDQERLPFEFLRFVSTKVLSHNPKTNARENLRKKFVRCLFSAGKQPLEQILAFRDKAQNALFDRRTYEIVECE